MRAFRYDPASVCVVVIDRKTGLPFKSFPGDRRSPPNDWKGLPPMRALRQPDDPGPSDMPGYDPFGFNLPPPDRGASIVRTIVGLLLCAILIAGLVLANCEGWLG